MESEGISWKLRQQSNNSICVVSERHSFSLLHPSAIILTVTRLATNAHLTPDSSRVSTCPRTVQENGKEGDGDGDGDGDGEELWEAGPVTGSPTVVEPAWDNDAHRLLESDRYGVDVKLIVIDAGTAATDAAAREAVGDTEAESVTLPDGESEPEPVQVRESELEGVSEEVNDSVRVAVEVTVDESDPVLVTLVVTVAELEGDKVAEYELDPDPVLLTLAVDVIDTDADIVDVVDSDSVPVTLAEEVEDALMVAEEVGDTVADAVSETVEVAEPLADADVHAMSPTALVVPNGHTNDVLLTEPEGQ